MSRHYAVGLERFYHTVKNEPHAHRGDEKPDDPGRGVYPLRPILLATFWA